MNDKILKSYNKMNLDDKRNMFEAILWNDVLIFNIEHKKLDDSNHVCFVSINGTQIQLTVHKDSNIEKEEEENVPG